MFKENLEQTVSTHSCQLTTVVNTLYAQEEDYEEERSDTTDWSTEEVNVIILYS